MALQRTEETDDSKRQRKSDQPSYCRSQSLNDDPSDSVPLGSGRGRSQYTMLHDIKDQSGTTSADWRGKTEPLKLHSDAVDPMTSASGHHKSKTEPQMNYQHDEHKKRLFIELKLEDCMKDLKNKDERIDGYLQDLATCKSQWKKEVENLKNHLEESERTREEEKVELQRKFSMTQKKRKEEFLENLRQEQEKLEKKFSVALTESNKQLLIAQENERQANVSAEEKMKENYQLMKERLETLEKNSKINQEFKEQLEKQKEATVHAEHTIDVEKKEKERFQKELKELEKINDQLTNQKKKEHQLRKKLEEQIKAKCIQINQQMEEQEKKFEVQLEEKCVAFQEKLTRLQILVKKETNQEKLWEDKMYLLEDDATELDVEETDDKVESPALDTVSHGSQSIGISSSGKREYVEDSCNEEREKMEADWFGSSPVYKYRVNSSDDRGVALIINNVNIKGAAPRGSSQLDANQLKETFEKLHYKTDIKKDLEAHEMLEKLSEYAQESKKEHDSFVCCILSHGGSKVILGKDGQVATEDGPQGILGKDGQVVTIIDLAITINAKNCPKLRGKPKLFFIQACRGDDMQEAIETGNTHTSLSYSSNSAGEKMETDGKTYPTVIPREADFLFGFSTCEGNVAARGCDTGSPYIKTLCKTFNDHASRLSLYRLLLLVNYEVAKTGNNFDEVKYHQMPEIRSTLLGEFHFRK